MRLSLLLCIGCTEYGFSTPEAGEKPAPWEADDTGWIEEETDELDTGGGNGDTELQADTSTNSDPCYEPEDGYALNPAARVVVDDGNEPIIVTFLGSDSGYNDELWVDAPTSRYLTNAWSESPGVSWEIGPFSAGTEIVFGTYVTNTGDRWQTGPASRNVDGVIHGATTFEGNCTWQVGFEDLNGGGDLDFNDVIFRISGPLRQEE